MIRLVKITPAEFKYTVYEGNKCVAEFIVEELGSENKQLLSAEMVEELRTSNYSVA